MSAFHEEQHSIAGMLRSLDCMPVRWKNCPVACQGSQTGKSEKLSIVLEAFMDYNLWFWHPSFGWPGSLNDINIWNCSCILKSFLDMSFATNVDFEFEVGNKVFKWLWLLVDSIYLELVCFVKTIQEPISQAAMHYMAWQEAACKDIECAFSMLQRKFHILVKCIKMWYMGDISSVMHTCVILHNMMVAKRMEDNEMESKFFYKFSGNDGDDGNSTHNEPEQLHVNHRVAELDLHQ